MAETPLRTKMRGQAVGCDCPATLGDPPRAGVNLVPDRLRPVVVVVLRDRDTCTLAENDVAGAPRQGSGEAASSTGPGTAPRGPVSSPSKEPDKPPPLSTERNGRVPLMERGSVLRPASAASVPATRVQRVQVLGPAEPTRKTATMHRLLRMPLAPR